MNVWNGIERYPERHGAVVASIGNYDGVHRGHRSILDSIVREARAHGLRSLLLTFDPHPLAIVAPDRCPPLLQTRNQKLLALAESGLDEVLVLGFDRDVASLSGEAFFEQVLDGRVDFAEIHVGESFRFGAGRKGDRTTLETIGAARGFSVRGVPPVRLGDRVVSSSAIREAVAAGDVDRARQMLGRPFALEGEVVHGAGRGRELRFPTANLEASNEMRPGNGVYVTETVIDGSRHPSVTNVGVRPTFSGNRPTVETHVLEFDQDLYDRRIELRFLARVRDERKFDSPAALAEQIARDVAAAEAWFHDRILSSG